MEPTAPPPVTAPEGPSEQTPPGAPQRPPAVFVDSSAIIALVDGNDASHEAATRAYRQLVAAGYRLFTTNYVVTETYDLLTTGVGPAVARRWLRDHRLPVYHADEKDERRARTLVIRSESSQGLSLTDAVSFVVMERFEVVDAFAVDPNFLSEMS